ncbi:MAG: hypothetical protein E6047_04025 [Mogibacterium sp.]|nr:hypothetical protein [Mogibacterium sp.]
MDRVNRLKELLKELSELDNLWAQGHKVTEPTLSRIIESSY